MLIIIIQSVYTINYKIELDSLKTEMKIQKQIEENKHLFKAFFQKDGYPNIDKIYFQDIDGFIWMKKEDNNNKDIFYKFDGVEFVNMSNFYYQVLNDSLLNVLEIPDDGYFLIFKRHIIRKINDSVVIKTFSPTEKISVKRDNKILYVRENDRIIKWDNSKLESFEKEKIFDFAIDYSGNLYIVYQNGYAFWGESGITEYVIPELNIENRKIKIEPFVRGTLILSISNQSENKLQFCFLNNGNIERYEIKRKKNATGIVAHMWSIFYPINKNYIVLREVDWYTNDFVIWSRKDKKIIDCNLIEDIPLDKITGIFLEKNGNRWIRGYQENIDTLIKIEFDGNRKIIPIKNDLSSGFDVVKNILLFGNKYYEFNGYSVRGNEEVFFINKEIFLSKEQFYKGFSGTYNNHIYSTIKSNRINININLNEEVQRFILPYKDVINRCYILNNNNSILLGDRAIYMLTTTSYTKLLEKKVFQIFIK